MLKSHSFELPLHLRPENIAFMPRFPVEGVVPRVVDGFERFAEGVPGIDGVRDHIRRPHRIPRPIEPLGERGGDQQMRVRLRSATFDGSMPISD